MTMTRYGRWIPAAVLAVAVPIAVAGGPASGPEVGKHTPAQNQPARARRDPEIVKWQALTPEQRAAKLAKAQKDLADVFGAELKRVAVTGSRADDLELAGRLLEARTQVADEVAFTSALCRKALELAERNPAGSKTVLAAVEALVELAPEDRPLWMEKIVDARQKAYFASRGPRRLAAGEALAEAQLDLARALTKAERFNEAVAACRNAVRVLRSIQSDKLAGCERTLEEVQDIQKIGGVMATLRSRLARNPKDQLARNELVRIYLVERDDPEKAASLINAGVPEDYRTHIPDAGKDIESLDEATCAGLGQWYRGLTDRASERGQKTVLGRAQTYLERFLELHTKADVDRLKAGMDLKKVLAALDELNAPPKPKSDAPFRQMFALDESRRLASGPNRYTTSSFQHRCFEGWVKAAAGNGLLYDQGNRLSGMAVAIYGQKVHFAMGDGVRHTQWVTDKEGPRKGKRRQVSIPAGVLSAEIPDRSKWFHVVAQFSSGTMALFVDGQLAGTRRIRSIVPGTGENTAVGGGEGSNAGYWSARNFGGKIGAFRVSNRTRYAKNFSPEALLTGSSAYSFLSADRMPTGKIDKYGTRDSASSALIKWIPIGGEIPIVPVD